MTVHLLSGGIEDLVHQRRTVGVLERQNVPRNFDQVGIQFARVPFGEDLVDFVGGKLQAVFQYIVSLADQLHVAVFDAVVNHLDVMAGTAFAHPVAAGHIAFHLRGDGLENILYERPRGGRTAGHDAGSLARAFLAAAHAGADVKQTFALAILCAAAGVIEQRVAAVNDDVAGREVRDELLDEFVHRLAGLDEHHHSARQLELGNHLSDGMCAEHFRALGLVREEVIHFFRGAVVGDDGEAVVVHVENEILAHDGQTDESDVALRLFHKYVLHDTEKAVLPASKKAGATVAGRVVGYFGSRLISASTLRMSVSVPV